MGAEVSITSGNLLRCTGQLSKTPVQVFRVRASRLHWPGVRCNSTLAPALGRKQTSVTALPPFLLFKVCPYSSIPTV